MKGSGIVEVRKDFESRYDTPIDVSPPSMV